MKKDTFKTDVVFRVITTKEFKGDIIALFPYEIENPNGFILSYTHIGQHSASDYIGCIGFSSPAKESEYKHLKNELESIGYNLNIIKKRNYQKYLNAYNK